MGGIVPIRRTIGIEIVESRRPALETSSRATDDGICVGRPTSCPSGQRDKQDETAFPSHGCVHPFETVRKPALSGPVFTSLRPHEIPPLYRCCPSGNTLVRSCTVVSGGPVRFLIGLRHQTTDIGLFQLLTAFGTCLFSA